MQDLFSRVENRLKAPPPARPSPAQSRSDESEEVGEVAKVFNRSLSDLVDRKVEEIMPAVAALYHRFEDELAALRADPDPPSREDLQDFLTDAAQVLGRLLQALGGAFIAPQVGEPYDPLIHLAVGEAEVDGADESMVAGVVRPGYKSGRGRVVLPARVLVGKR